MGAGEFMIGTDIGVGAGGWRAAEAVEEAGCSWAAGSLPWDCEEAASAILVSGASQGRLSCDIQTSELLVGRRYLLQG